MGRSMVGFLRHGLKIPPKKSLQAKVFPLPACKLFQIHGSKFKFLPLRNASQASHVGIAHSVLFFGIGKDPQSFSCVSRKCSYPNLFCGCPLPHPDPPARCGAGSTSFPCHWHRIFLCKGNSSIRLVYCGRCVSRFSLLWCGAKVHRPGRPCSLRLRCTGNSKV